MIECAGGVVVQDRRALERLRVELAQYNRTFPETMQEQPVPTATGRPPRRAWRSRRFIALLFQEPHKPLRLSVCRAMLNEAGQYEDAVTWDDLQAVKSQCGFGAVDAVEIYPRDADVVNVANMRHLWLLPEGCPYTWR